MQSLLHLMGFLWIIGFDFGSIFTSFLMSLIPIRYNTK
ncbi:hypothetical protein MNB_SV-14-384 [hydrothermal vent metagenome]|uniref:Uncharacterized protein n=1 Tax=hydrothermal vent metagenome TaxID=652676 RepID=A0A1W1CEM2_9ZZZZ